MCLIKSGIGHDGIDFSEREGVLVVDKDLLLAAFDGQPGGTGDNADINNWE